jgi:D-beta-D-heptose 7-phosphate kinase/D-beta-D-heptose 1-phosphate adenosyltransferase
MNSMHILDDFLRRGISGQIAVAGDVMIDEYYYVDVKRLSPEFPIPVLASKEIKPDLALPGGAANVARQFQNFGMAPFLYSFSDERSKEIFHTCNGIGPDGYLVSNKVPQIPVKKRFYQGDFPICRWDVENKDYGSNFDDLEAIRTALIGDWKVLNPAITILSDYDKGFFSDATRKQWVSGPGVTIVDPKRGPPSAWEGCTIFKPNAKEAEEMTGSSDWRYQALDLQAETDATCVLITQGSEGVAGVIHEDLFFYRPKQKVKATSVIGAGDCFVAFLALALAKNMSPRQAAEVAFEAGAIYVQKKHNEPITIAEMERKFDLSQAKFGCKPPPRDFRLAFANGCFDVLHEGHIELLQFAKSTADKLVVAVNSDESVRRLKGDGRPVNSLVSRMKMLAALEFVDFVVPFDDATPLELIRVLKPDVLIKGGDYRLEEVVGRELVENVLIFPTVPGYSTTRTIELLNAAGTGAGSATAFA